MTATHRLDQWMYKGGRPNRAARGLNRAWATLAGRGLAPARLTCLEVKGRHTGATIVLPVVVADYQGDRYLVSMLGEDSNWVRNVRAAGGRAIIRHRGAETVRLLEVPPADRAPILRRYLECAPGARTHIPLDPHAPQEAIEAIAGNYPVFRITPG
jgi:hypothetical protein